MVGGRRRIAAGGWVFYIALAFIMHLQGKITGQGRLLRQDDLLVSEVSTSKNITKTEKLNFQNRKVFLFEQIIIFSETQKVKTPLQNPGYFYRSSIKVGQGKTFFQMTSRSKSAGQRAVLEVRC